jgi:hypothetical protein
MNLTQGQFQAIGFVILVCFVLILVFSTAMNSFAGRKGLVLETEFLKDELSLKKLVGDVGSKERDGIRSALIVDTFGFIPIYFALFTLISWFLAQQNGSFSKYIALAGFFFAIVTVVFDLSENLNLYKSLGGSEIKDGSIYLSAIGKWICFFITSAILSTVFWQPNWYLIVAVLFLLGSIVGVIFLHLLTIDQSKIELFQIPTMLIVIGTFIVGIGFTFFSANAGKIFNAR